MACSFRTLAVLYQMFTFITCLLLMCGYCFYIDPLPFYFSTQGHSFLNNGLDTEWASFVSYLHTKLRIMSRGVWLCNRFSLWHLGPWMKHLPPVRWSTSGLWFSKIIVDMYFGIVEGILFIIFCFIYFLSKYVFTLPKFCIFSSLSTLSCHIT